MRAVLANDFERNVLNTFSFPVTEGIAVCPLASEIPVKLGVNS